MMIWKYLPPLWLLLLLAGCGRQSSLSPHGPAARQIGNLEWAVLILFCVVTVVMWALIAIVISRPRGSLAEHAPFNVGGGLKWIFIGGFAIPALILAGVYISGLDVLSSFPMHDGAILMPAQIKITGHQWWWEVEYLEGPLQGHFTTANEIHIPAGQPVDIDLTSIDVIHSFWVPSLHGKVDLIPGVMNRIRIQANRVGEYRGQCAQYCGEEHAKMILLVVAQRPDQFRDWLANERKDAAAPVTAEQKQGQQVFLSHACMLCHTIRGTLAQGQVGPELTHLASRKMIASNLLPNDTADLAAWSTHAQSLKPGVLMPNLTEFNGLELNDLVAYLQSLH
jgi:cytochrome c oxidase subunit 2